MPLRIRARCFMLILPYLLDYWPLFRLRQWWALGFYMLTRGSIYRSATAIKLWQRQRRRTAFVILKKGISSGSKVMLSKQTHTAWIQHVTIRRFLQCHAHDSSTFNSDLECASICVLYLRLCSRLIQPFQATDVLKSLDSKSHLEHAGLSDLLVVNGGHSENRMSESGFLLRMSLTYPVVSCGMTGIW